MGGYGLGIDLGTTYSAAAVHSNGVTEMVSLGNRATIVPSAVFVTESGDVLVGDAALRRGAAAPDRLCREFKRRIGDSVPIIVGGSPFSSEALTARLLRWIATTVAEQRGSPPDRVALTYPANWGAFKQERLTQAIRIAELADLVEGADGGGSARSEGIVTLTEPEAAAVSYASTERLPVDDVVAVYDMGGGTFDAAVLRKTTSGFELLGSPEGIERLGGIDVDEAIYAHVRGTLGEAALALDDEDPAVVRALARLRLDCTEAKEALSADTQVSIPVLLPNLHTEVRLTRGELETMMRPVLEDTVGALRRAITSTGLSATDVDRVLLVGGSSRIPLVAQMVTEALGRPFFVDAHPKHAVALGAAQSAAGALAPSLAPPVPAPLPVPAPSMAPPVAAAVPAAPPPPAARAPVPPPSPPVTPPPPARPIPPAPENRPGRMPTAAEVQTEESPIGPVTPATPVPAIRSEPAPVSADEYQPEPPPLGRPRRQVPSGGGRRRQVVVGAVAVVLVAIAAFVALRPDDKGDGNGGNDGNGGGAPELTVAGTTAVSDLPDGVAVDGDNVYVATTGGNEVVRLDVPAGAVQERFPLDGGPLAVLVAEGSLWVTQKNAATVSRLDPTTGEVQATIDVPQLPSVLAAGAGQIWLGTGSGSLVRIDPATDTATTVRDDLGNVAGVAVADDGLVWAGVFTEDRVIAIDPATDTEVASVAVGQQPDAVVAAPSGIWVANRGGSTLSRIDPSSRTVDKTVEVGGEPLGLAVDGDRIWAISRGDGTLVLVDGEAAEVVTKTEVGAGLLGVAVSPDRVWVTVGGDNTVARVDVSTP